MADLPGPPRPGAGHGPLLRIAAPITLVSLSTPLVGAVDTAVVGRLGDPALIGGIAAAAVLFNLIFLTLGFLRFSTTGLAAQAVGAGDHDEAAAVLVRAGVLAVGLGALVIGAELLAGGFALDLLAVDGAAGAAALAYADLRVLSAPFGFANFALLGWLIGTGAIGRAVVLQVLLNLVNIGASVWLVVHAGWGVRGAALAAVIAEAATFAAGALMVAARLRDRRDRAWTKARDVARVRRMLAINGDILVRSVVLFLVIALFTRQGARFGTVTLAANAVLLNLFYLAGAFMSGLATAAQQTAGQALGAGDRGAFERVVRLALLWGALGSLLLTAVYGLAGDRLIGLMTADAAVAATARSALGWAVAVPLAGLVAFIADGVFIGATWARDARNMMLVSAGLFVAAWATLVPAFGNDGLWAAFLLFLAVRGLSLALRYPPLLRTTFGG